MYKEKQQNIKKLLKELNKEITPKQEINQVLEKQHINKITDKISLHDLLKRPEATVDKLKPFLKENYTQEVKEEIEIMIKYEGYIKKSKEEAKKQAEYENITLKENIDYSKIPNLALEAREKLNKIKPNSLGQAMRISGVNPSDISSIMIYLKRGKNE
mgnify:FL=1